MRESKTCAPMPVSKSVLEKADRYGAEFGRARPFKHAVIEDFFEPEFAERLLADFPAFNPALAKNEIYGGVWGKAVNTQIREISPAYDELYRLIGSTPFLELMSRMTGIPELQSDPALYGGGTHENLHGQDLDPHVDFNYDEQSRLHRRLNLIVYLNKGWKAEWGGSLEIHSNPRKPAENWIQAWEPLFNRAVLFETNEYSWHGFPKIELPEEERHRSRKSISIYLYTRERPAEEIAPAHGTFYVHRPLDKRWRAGRTLTEADEKELRFQVDRRDKWIEKYQRMELDQGAELERRETYIRELLSRVRAPLTGYALQEGASEGLFADGWVGREARLTVRPLRRVECFTVRGWRPEPGAKIKVKMNGDWAAEAVIEGSFEIAVTPGAAIETPFVVEIECQPGIEAPGDDRDLAFVLRELRVEHAALTAND
jgi:hypothetical protein